MLNPLQRTYVINNITGCTMMDERSSEWEPTELNTKEILGRDAHDKKETADQSPRALKHSMYGRQVRTGKETCAKETFRGDINVFSESLGLVVNRVDRLHGLIVTR